MRPMAAGRAGVFEPTKMNRRRAERTKIPLLRNALALPRPILR